MYGVYNSPELMVAVAELDVGTVVTTIAGVPQIHIVALLAVGVSILSPYLPSGREMH